MLLRDYLIMFGLTLVAALIVYGVFFLPPLTTRGPAATAVVDQQKFETVYEEELDHCEDQPEGYDCECFARISGIVRAGDGVKISGAVHADRQELARVQAAGSC